MKLLQFIVHFLDSLHAFRNFIEFRHADTLFRLLRNLII